MDSLLQEINMLPGILGCFVYNSKQQIAGKKMPPIFKDNAIQSIGNLLARTVQMGRMAELNFTDIELRYNESAIIVTPLTTGALLIIICEPTTNKSLVSMTTGMLAKDIEAALTGMPQATQQPRPQAAVPVQSIEKPPPPPQEAEIGAELAPVLEQIKDALALAIGPIAAPVMKDSIEIWAQQNEPSIVNIPVLAEILCSEINDEDLEGEFMDELKSINN
jgi:hypothetical protein